MNPSPLSVGLGWLLFAAFVLALLAGWTLTLGLIRAAARHQTHRPADADTGSAGRCTNRKRGATGLVWVLVAEHLGGGLDRVCHGCAAEGMKRGWFRASLDRDATVYDIAVANACHDIDDIEAFANGETA